MSAFSGFRGVKSKAPETQFTHLLIFKFTHSFSMPGISQKGLSMPASPIRKLVPYADAAKKKGVKVYHI